MKELDTQKNDSQKWWVVEPGRNWRQKKKKKGIQLRVEEFRAKWIKKSFTKLIFSSSVIKLKVGFYKPRWLIHDQYSVPSSSSWDCEDLTGKQQEKSKFLK